MKPHSGHSVDGLREGCRGGIPVWAQGEEENDPLPYISTFPYHRVICLVSLIIKQQPPSILAADVIGYSRLMADNEAGTLNRLQSLLRDIIEPKIETYCGRTVKLMGDGLLADFSSTVNAVTCAPTANCQRQN